MVKGDFHIIYILDDGPSANLMNFMGEHGFKAPSDWPGFRYEGGGH